TRPVDRRMARGRRDVDRDRPAGVVAPHGIGSLASAPRLRGRRGVAVALVGVVLLVAACAAPSTGGASSPSPSAGAVMPIAVVLVAENIALSPAELHVPVGTPIALHLDHRDAGVPHGLVLEAPTTPPTRLYTGQNVTGPE